MKKISLYLLLAFVGMLTTACNEDFKDWNDPQSYPQEDAVTIPGYAAAAADVIDLRTIAEDFAIRIFNLPANALPEGYELADARIIANPTDINTIVNTEIACGVDGMLENAKAPLQTMVKDTYGLRPVERNFTAHVLLDAKKDGQAVLIDAGAVTLVVIPEAPEIEEAYYITGTCNGWNNSNTDFELSNGGADPYENPVYTCMIPAESVSGDLEFKVTPKSGIGGDWSKCLCADGENEGKFVGNNLGGNFKVPAVDGAKFYKVTFDMMAFTWKVDALNFADYIYEVGNNTGWGSVIPLKHVNTTGEYVGYAYLDGDFKFRPNENDWNGDWGQDPAGAPGTLVQEGENNCTIDHAAFYMMNVNLGDMTWKVTELTTIGLIGSATPNGWDGDTPMTYNVTDGCWEITVDLVAGEIKFRANGGWDINWGGTPAELRNGGENLPIEAAGNYTIKLYPICDGKSHCTIVKN
ncbi:MAG: DUF5115 domain-containing protein [Bacteroidales bacterium]|nr:DUF5115 domain-containing protein [Bacteroidales bacterium]